MTESEAYYDWAAISRLYQPYALMFGGTPGTHCWLLFVLDSEQKYQPVPADRLVAHVRKLLPLMRGHEEKEAGRWLQEMDERMKPK